MPNFFIENPESIIFTVVFLAMFIYGINKNIVYSTKVSELAKKLNLLAPDSLDEYADVHTNLDFASADPNYGILSLVADKYHKGYDFIIIDQPKAGSQVPLHRHKRSNELFYVLKGKIRIYICDKKATVADCLEGCEKATELSVGDWLFVEAKREHCIEVIKPTKYIVIAKPQLFSRIGKLYEFLFKKENKQA